MIPPAIAAHVYDAPVVHAGDAVGEMEDALIVGDDDHGAIRLYRVIRQ